MRKITRVKKVHNAMYVMECPRCGEICASASERELMPQWTTCPECPDDFRIYSEKNKQIIERTVYPRFRGVITFSAGLSDVEDIEMLEPCNDAQALAAAMREAGEYIVSAGIRSRN